MGSIKRRHGYKIKNKKDAVQQNDRLHEQNELFASGADLVLEPFQDAADRAVELLCGAPEEERTEIPSIKSEEQQTS